MSDLAASGGYYIALGGDAIVAQPGTLTGSIGVYTGKFVTSGTLEKLGANIEATSSGKHAEIYSPDRPLHAGRAEQDRGVDAGRLRPVHRARRPTARHMTPEKVDEIAQGRVWTGAAGEADRPRRRAGRALQGDRPGQAARAHSSATKKSSWWCIRRTEASTKCWPSNCRRRSGELQAASTSDALMELLGPRERRALAAVLAPSRLFRSGKCLRTCRMCLSLGSVQQVQSVGLAGRQLKLIAELLTDAAALRRLVADACASMSSRMLIFRPCFAFCM